MVSPNLRRLGYYKGLFLSGRPSGGPRRCSLSQRNRAPTPIYFARARLDLQPRNGSFWGCHCILHPRRTNGGLPVAGHRMRRDCMLSIPSPACKKGCLLSVPNPAAWQARKEARFARTLLSPQAAEAGCKGIAAGRLRRVSPGTKRSSAHPATPAARRRIGPPIHPARACRRTPLSKSHKIHLHFSPLAHGIVLEVPQLRPMPVFDFQMVVKDVALFRVL